MLNIELLKSLLTISIALSAITCTIVQKTKDKFKKSKILPIYSLIINLLLGIVFCQTFTDVSFPKSIWVGLFSFIGADSIYKMLEGKISTHTQLRQKDEVKIPRENIINGEDFNGEATISK